jgi:predicted anti-sigma-YlaC factor YlaD
MMDAVVGSCEETQEQLSDRLEGDLRGLRRLRVAAHLSRCDRCRAVMRSLSRTVEQVRLLGRGDYLPPPGPSVTDDVVERIRRERHE